MFLRSPVIKLSIPITSYPSWINRSHRCEPRKPAAPVIKTRPFIVLISSHKGYLLPIDAKIGQKYTLHGSLSNNCIAVIPIIR